MGCARLCRLQKGCTRLARASDKDYQLLAHGRWFSPGTPASSTIKTGRHDIAEILLKVALNTKNQSINQSIFFCDLKKMLIRSRSLIRISFKISLVSHDLSYLTVIVLVGIHSFARNVKQAPKRNTHISVQSNFPAVSRAKNKVSLILRL